MYQVTYPHWFPPHMKGVSPPAATEAGVPDLVSKKVNPPPGTGAVQGTRAVKMEMSPPTCCSTKGARPGTKEGQGH